MFSGFDTARKAAWFRLMRLECVSDCKDSQMLLCSIRESKGSGKEVDRGRLVSRVALLFDTNLSNK